MKLPQIQEDLILTEDGGILKITLPPETRFKKLLDWCGLLVSNVIGLVLLLICMERFFHPSDYDLPFPPLLYLVTPLIYFGVLYCGIIQYQRINKKEAKG